MINWNKGDKLVCTCGEKKCSRFFTITKVYSQTITVIDDKGEEDAFGIDNGYIVPLEIYESPLYKALR